MKHVLGRRSLLGLMAAAPVMAREATAKVLGSERPLNGAISGGCIPATPGGNWERDWLKDRLRDIASGKRRKEIQRDASRVYAIDPDLAAMRSISLSTAVRIQKERNIAKLLEDERERHHERALELFGMGGIGQFLNSLNGDA